MIELLMTQSPQTCYIMIAILALVIGSLLNVIIYRLPIMLEPTEQQNAKERSINLFFPGSFCPTCKTNICFQYNIPLFGYLFTGGHCSFCKHKISMRYPLVELLTLLFSLAAAIHFGLTIYLLFSMIFISIIICLTFIDISHQLLPDELTLGLLWMGLIANTENLFTTLPDAVLSAAMAYVCLWLFAKIFYLITHKEGMGHGDFKLFAAFGAWFGGLMLPFILFFASFIGAGIGIIYLKTTGKNKNTPIPFGPFLCASGVFVLFFKQSIVRFIHL